MNKIAIEPIATIRSPFCDLINIPVQPHGAKDIYATIEFKKVYEVSKKRSDDRFVGEKK